MEFHIVHLRILDCSGNSVCAPSYIINILFYFLFASINQLNQSAFCFAALGYGKHLSRITRGRIPFCTLLLPHLVSPLGCEILIFILQTYIECRLFTYTHSLFRETDVRDCGGSQCCERNTWPEPKPWTSGIWYFGLSVAHVRLPHFFKKGGFFNSAIRAIVGKVWALHSAHCPLSRLDPFDCCASLRFPGQGLCRPFPCGCCDCRVLSYIDV